MPPSTTPFTKSLDKKVEEEKEKEVTMYAYHDFNMLAMDERREGRAEGMEKGIAKGRAESQTEIERIRAEKERLQAESQIQVDLLKKR